MFDDPAILVLMYFIMPLWLMAGFADYLCHRWANISETAGSKESAIHLLMFAEVGAPLLLALFAQIDALVILVMILALLLHEATALWDVRYASQIRCVSFVEQHVHSFLEMIPLAALIVVAMRHWSQFLALFGFGNEPADFSLRWKVEPLPAVYTAVVLGAIILFEFLPYLEELNRSRSARRAKQGAFVRRA